MSSVFQSSQIDDLVNELKSDPQSQQFDDRAQSQNTDAADGTKDENEVTSENESSDVENEEQKRNEAHSGTNEKNIQMTSILINLPDDVNAFIDEMFGEMYDELFVVSSIPQTYAECVLDLNRVVLASSDGIADKQQFLTKIKQLVQLARIEDEYVFQLRHERDVMVADAQAEREVVAESYQNELNDWVRQRIEELSLQYQRNFPDDTDERLASFDESFEQRLSEFDVDLNEQQQKLVKAISENALRLRDPSIKNILLYYLQKVTLDEFEKTHQNEAHFGQNPSNSSQQLQQNTRNEVTDDTQLNDENNDDRNYYPNENDDAEQAAVIRPPELNEEEDDKNEFDDEEQSSNENWLGTPLDNRDDTDENEDENDNEDNEDEDNEDTDNEDNEDNEDEDNEDEDNEDDEREFSDEQIDQFNAAAEYIAQNADDEIDYDALLEGDDDEQIDNTDFDEEVTGEEGDGSLEFDESDLEEFIPTETDEKKPADKKKEKKNFLSNMSSKVQVGLLVGGFLLLAIPSFFLVKKAISPAKPNTSESISQIIDTSSEPITTYKGLNVGDEIQVSAGGAIFTVKIVKFDTAGIIAADQDNKSFLVTYEQVDEYIKQFKPELQTTSQSEASSEPAAPETGSSSESTSEPVSSDSAGE